jgi:hypothetical protein
MAGKFPQAPFSIRLGISVRVDYLRLGELLVRLPLWGLNHGLGVLTETPFWENHKFLSLA